MNAAVRSHAFERALAAALAVCTPASAQKPGDAMPSANGMSRLPRNAQGQLDDPNTFLIANALAYRAYDVCGDALHGDLLRQAIAQKFAGCPFSAQARDTLRASLQTLQQQVRTAVSQGFKPAPATCPTSSLQWRTALGELDAYARDRRRLPPSLASIACDQVPVAP